jgi:uncharacterized protein
MARLSQTLVEEDYDHMAAILDRFQGERAMNLEMLDGFFAALICGPELVLPSEYLPEIWGGDLPDEVLRDRGELQRFLDLVMRHWNGVVHTLHSDDDFVPLLFEDDKGVARGNDWANGFARGMDCVAKIGPHFLMMQSTLACWYLSLRLHMNIIPIRKCDPIKSR